MTSDMKINALVTYSLRRRILIKIRVDIRYGNYKPKQINVCNTYFSLEKSSNKSFINTKFINMAT